MSPMTVAEKAHCCRRGGVWHQFGIQGEVKKGADGGIDGELIRYNVGGEVVRAILSVKGGGVNVECARFGPWSIAVMLRSVYLSAGRRPRQP
jgi:hypothetical protein